MENIRLNTLEYEELLNLSDKIKETINFIEKEIEENTEEV